MTKFAALAALAAVALTSLPVVPSLAQQTQRVDVNCAGAKCETSRSTTDHNCSSQIGHLTRVFPVEVLGIEREERVWVTEFCLGDSLMRADGNAAYLRTSIARNDVLVDVLQDKGYFPEDVFAVRMMGDDTINLYVHRFRD